jgi:hypothetical protein
MHDKTTADRGVTSALTRAGHDVVRCWEPGSPSPCVAADGGGCPLDGSVDVAVAGDDAFGVVCALRDGVPVVLAGAGSHSAFDGRWDAVASSADDVPAACERAVGAAAQRAGRYVSSFAGAPASVERHGHHVRVQLDADADGRTAVLAHQAATRLFPNARSIDIGRRS